MQWGIECGATTTVALVAPSERASPRRFTEVGANAIHTSDQEFLALFERLRARNAGAVESVGIAVAGCRSAADRARIQGLGRQVFEGARVSVGSDLDASLLAAGPLVSPRVLMVSGTGSAFVGQSPSGARVQIGGWGAILGDKGSGYEIGLRAAKASVYYLDRDGALPSLGRALLDHLGLVEPNQLVTWSVAASKAEIAALAPLVFAEAQRDDSVAKDILDGACHSLVKDALTCARRAFGASNQGVEFVMTGSVLARQPAFRQSVSVELTGALPGSSARLLERESAYGALAMGAEGSVVTAEAGQRHSTEGAPVTLESLDRSPTELRNPRSMGLGAMSVRDALALFWDEEPLVVSAARAETESIAGFIDAVCRTFDQGGALYYVGAGTSGRLGVLDASECPPTFGTDPAMVQGVMAGGARALQHSVEGAEDDPQAGAESVRYRGVGAVDCVLGIAASGRTPFVWGALREAKRGGATTGLLCMNPSMGAVAGEIVDHCIALDVGPELLTGSTRLKSGTATKLVLNAITTIAMARQGKVIENLMVDVNPSNEKLRRRAVGILVSLCGARPDEAKQALEECGWVISKAHRLMMGD